MQQKLPSEPTTYFTQYKTLLGVDYQKDVTDVDKSRSPNMINMISDLGGNPIKRDGFRVVGNRYAVMLTANSITFGIRPEQSGNFTIAKLEMSEETFKIAESDTKRVYENCGNINNAFSYQKYIYVICDNAMVRYDTQEQTYIIVGTQENMMSTGVVGESSPKNEDNIPTTVFALSPSGVGGTTLDDKNLFSIYQRVQFIGTADTVEYTIPNYKKVGAWVKAEVLNEHGEWVSRPITTTATESVTGASLDGTTTITSNVVGTKITFGSAPGVPPVAGKDNVRITFAPYSTEQIKIGETTCNRGFYNKTFLKLLESKASIYFSSRLFIADENRTYYSEVNDPFSISDLSWFDVDNVIMCYTRASSYLAIITKDNGRNTIFLASEVTTTSSETQITTDSAASKTVSTTYYSVKASNAGIGAVTRKCIGVLSDEPLFLSTTGMFGILTNWQSEKYAVNRSSRINRKLCKESNLENAVGVAWNDYFYIAINGKMYVLDSRHKDSDKAGNKCYECYFFDNIPICNDMFVINNRMYFVDNYNTYTWNNDLPETVKYYDYAVRDEDTGEWSGTPVKALWSSTFDGDGHPEKLKTLQKKGSMVTITPHYKSGCELTLIKDGDEFQYLGRVDTNLFSFERIDFTKFIFESNSVTSDIFTKKKIKKYKRLQIVLENNEPEPFGITNVVKTYVYGNYAKR